MSDIERAIKIGELVVTSTEALLGVADNARETLATSTADVKQVIAAAKKKASDDLASDRKADDALDKKFESADVTKS